PVAWADADVIFVSPGITPGFAIRIPGIAEAAARGAIISNHTQLLFERSPAPIAGVTGSAGKTTTTTLLGEMLQTSFADDASRRVYVGGNMGIPLINEVALITADDVVVLELSEVQLARLHASPHIGVITNITPDHYDRYPTFEEYVRAKRQIVRDMRPGDYAILNADNIPASESAAETVAHALYFSRTQPIERGADIREGAFWLRLPDSAPIRLCGIGETRLPGNHNHENILAASLAAYLAGATPKAIAQVIRTFGGVANRIEFVAERGGVRYYNDSIATSPNRALAALRTFDEPILLIAGGKDKNLPWEEIASEIVRRVRVIAVLGVSAPKILDAIAVAQTEVPAVEQRLKRIERVASVEEAVRVLAASAQPGEVVLLSPGCASHDMFSGFEERGERFAQAVRSL
ncbi:MAG TPA: UDP-N-acetylmuramoyl-L-alanine--D-glutamate ligase, partial [Ktedonobacterales bacterium]|nr:UDP-N-acetylmuramoyl-L-alanine--D-glutamate ligase [Ktedonobacterales bacterium]